MKSLILFFAILQIKAGVYSQQLKYFQNGNGQPTVIFVSGMGEDHSTWKQVQDSVSIRTTTISYDRAGLGVSKYCGERKDLESMSNELDHLITMSGITEPLVLVGHSLGCQIIKLFSVSHPNKVRSIIFIDPGYNPKKLRSVISDSLWHAREKKLQQYMPRLSEAQQAEVDQLENNTQQADRIRHLPPVPIVLFTATLVTDFPASEQEIKIKMQAHDSWLKDFPKAKHVLVEESRHYIHQDFPEMIIAEILKQL